MIVLDTDFFSSFFKISIPTFLLRYKRERKISVEEIKGIIKDLREKDFYAFSKEVEEELLQTFSFKL